MKVLFAGCTFDDNTLSVLKQKGIEIHNTVISNLKRLIGKDKIV
ncbi:MAG: hypothetical protein Q4G04_03455 [bacterium]|nr:hypothetical protein [bacterium]